MQITPCKASAIDLDLTQDMLIENSKHTFNGKTRKHFLKFFLDIGYFLCVFPYKIDEGIDGSYRGSGWRLQKILCGLVHTAAIADAVTGLRSIRYSNESSDPRLYFETLTFALHIGTLTAFAYSLLRNADKFSTLVTMVQRCPIISLWYPKKMTAVLSVLIALYIVLALLNPIFKEGGDSATLYDTYEFHRLRGRFMLFLEYSPPRTDHLLSLSGNRTTLPSFELFNIGCAFISYFVCSAQWIVVYHIDSLMIVMSVTLWTASRYFSNALQTEKNCQNAFINYEALRNMSDIINSAIGIVTLTYTVDSILFYSTQLEVMFTGTNWFHKVVVIQFFLGSVSWLNFASNACMQMDRFREWIRKKDNRCNIPSKSISIMLLLDELSTNSVGLSGNGLFTVNYSFVAQALTTLMTYFIIVIQFKKST